MRRDGVEASILLVSGDSLGGSLATLALGSGGGLLLDLLLLASNLRGELKEFVNLSKPQNNLKNLAPQRPTRLTINCQNFRTP